MRYMDEFSVKDARVRQYFWSKVKNSLRRAPFLREAIAAYYCATDKRTPLHVKAALIGALAYFILPLDSLPDFIAVLGFTDDAAVLLAAIRAVRPFIKEEHRLAAQTKLDILLKAHGSK